MSYSDLAIANVSIASSSTTRIDGSDFTTTSDESLAASDPVFVRSVIHEDDVTINRMSDPNTDGTFELVEQIESRTGGGERHSDTLLVYDDQASLQLVNDSDGVQDITLIGEYVDPTTVFVESATGVSDGSELTRGTGSHDSEEAVLEVATSGDAELVRRYDPDDDGTFELDATVDTLLTGTVVTETWLPSVDVSGRTNVAMETALRNVSGSTNDMLIIGTITE
jgi:hypothetical protein